MEHSMIEVREGRLGRSVYARRRIEPGAIVLRGWGPRVSGRTRHSFQIDFDTHIVIRNEIELINHSCEPNCGVLVRPGLEVMEIHALRLIAQGEELTTDYATFEYEIEHMDGPCLCGTPACRGLVTGYRDLPPDRRARFGPYIAPYLLEIEELVPIGS
jgi:hypothetical protein